MQLKLTCMDEPGVFSKSMEDQNSQEHPSLQEMYMSSVKAKSYN